MNLYLLFINFICSFLTLINAEPLEGVNVVSANLTEFPFIASLGYMRSIVRLERFHFCTGTLITKKHVITAAHCLIHVNKNPFDVIIGDVDLRTANVRYNVDSWITYDEWARSVGKELVFNNNDVAILTLSSTVDRYNIVPAMITNLNAKQLHRTKAIMAGWGITHGEIVSHVLKKGRVKIMTPQQCAKNLKLVSNEVLDLPENYLCSSANPYVLTRSGDSGGPLLDENNFFLGVTRSTGPNRHWGSFPLEFLNQYKINVHIDINYYIDFIEAVTGIQVRLT